MTAEKPLRKRTYQTGAERVRAGKPTATDEVVIKLRAWLTTGRIVPGQRLTEADLSRELAVSKGPVREAMQRLAAEGIIDLAPYRGYVVHRMTREEVASVFDVLELLEGLAARRAAENIDHGDHRARLKKAVSEFDDAHYELSRVRQSGNEGSLYSLLMELSNNKMLMQFAARIQYSIFPLQFRALQSRGVPVTLLELVRKYVGAILAGDPKAAESGARAHTRALREHILSLPDEWFEPKKR
jgi:DNA-binding GntR family transcriptional regulator